MTVCFSCRLLTKLITRRDASGSEFVDFNDVQRRIPINTSTLINSASALHFDAFSGFLKDCWSFMMKIKYTKLFSAKMLFCYTLGKLLSHFNYFTVGFI